MIEWLIDNAFERWASRTKWEGSQIVMTAVRRHHPIGIASFYSSTNLVRN